MYLQVKKKGIEIIMHLKQSSLSKNVMKTTSGVLAALSVLSNSAFAISPDDSKKSSSISPNFIIGITVGGLLMASGFSLWCTVKSEKIRALMDYRDSLDTINSTKNKTGLYHEICIVEEFLKNKFHKDNAQKFKRRFKKIKEKINEIDDKNITVFSSFKVILVEDLKSIVTNVLEDTNLNETGKVTDFDCKIKKVEKKVEDKSVESQTTEPQINESKTSESKISKFQTNESQSNEPQTSESQTTESKTNESKTTESKTNESKTTESKTNESKTTESKTNESQTNESQTNESQANESKTSEFQTTESQTTESQISESQISESQITEARVDKTKINEKSVGKESIVDEKYKQELREFIEKNLKSENLLNGITDDGIKMETLKMVVGNLLAIICRHDNPEALLVKKLKKTYELETLEKVHQWIVSIDEGVKQFEEFYNGCNLAVKAEVSLSVEMLRKFADSFC